MRKPCRRELKGHLRSTHINRGLRGRRRSCARWEAFARTFEDEPFSEIRLTIKVEKRILEISQSTTDLWKTYFRAKKPRRFENFQNSYKWRNQADKRHCLIFIFHPGPRKRPKKPEVWKNRLWAQSGSGYWKTESEYQNPRKGTETGYVLRNGKWRYRVRVPKSP